MPEKKILFIVTEVSPYLADSEQSLIARHLSQGIYEKGREVRIFMPNFGAVNERRNQLHEVIRLSGLNIIINDTDHPLVLKVAGMPATRLQVYFIDNDDYFARKRLFHTIDGEEFTDNGERAIFFVRGVMETIKKLRWFPDLIHCHGWISALTPLYIKKYYKNDPCFKHTKVVYSIYDDEFYTFFSHNFHEILKIENVKDKDVVGVKANPDFEALSKLAIDFSDGVIQGSPKIYEGLKEYALSKGVPFLDFQGEDVYIDKFNELYDKLLLEK
ncbi:glycogen synthase [Bacteroidia bacterium]|nr:glycogen synthase [Bacteroidia bacterium]